MLQVLRRLLSLPLCSHERQFPASSAAVAKGIYGLEAQSIPRAELSPLRTALLHVVWERETSPLSGGCGDNLFPGACPRP